MVACLIRVLCMLGLLAGFPALLVGQRPLDRYDHSFRKYSKRYFGPGYDWREFKAQGLTESGLDSGATSGVGARGIMQLMPSTFSDIQSKNPLFTSIHDPEWNIAAGVYHDRQMWRLWTDDVVADDQTNFMFGSYNAGRSPLLRAQDVARLRGLDERAWASVVAVAPDVPRWRHQETLNYVERISENVQRLDSRGRLLPQSSPAPVPATSVPPSQSPARK